MFAVSRMWLFLLCFVFFCLNEMAPFADDSAEHLFLHRVRILLFFIGCCCLSLFLCFLSCPWSHYFFFWYFLPFSNFSILVRPLLFSSIFTCFLFFQFMSPVFHLRFYIGRYYKVYFCFIPPTASFPSTPPFFILSNQKPTKLPIPPLVPQNSFLDF